MFGNPLLGGFTMWFDQNVHLRVGMFTESIGRLRFRPGLACLGDLRLRPRVKIPRQYQQPSVQTLVPQLNFTKLDLCPILPYWSDSLGLWLQLGFAQLPPRFDIQRIDEYTLHR
jgi:hypothetical protein